MGAGLGRLPRPFPTVFFVVICLFNELSMNGLDSKFFIDVFTSVDTLVFFLNGGFEVAGHVSHRSLWRESHPGRKNPTFFIGNKATRSCGVMCCQSPPPTPPKGFVQICRRVDTCQAMAWRVKRHNPRVRGAHRRVGRRTRRRAQAIP